MTITQAAYRYARALMQLARERGELDAAREDMQLVAEACGASRELRLLLASPVLKADVKTKVLGRVFGGKIGSMTERFIHIMVRKGREQLLPQVAEAFQFAYREDQGVLLAEVRSAVPLGDEAREKIKQIAGKRHPGKHITLSEAVDPALIGGVIVRIGDEQMDGSVSRRLSDLGRKFSENPYIPEI